MSGYLRTANVALMASLVLGLVAGFAATALGDGATDAIAERLEGTANMDERKALLDELGQCDSLDAMRLAESLLANPDLAREAGLAMVGIAPRIQASHPDHVVAAMQRLLATSKDADVIRLADKVLKDASRSAADETGDAGSGNEGTGRASAAPLPKEPNYRWEQTDSTLALRNHDRVVWRFNFASDLSKPYFHPVALTDGTVLTMPSPADHPWHKALWFSWKMLNGVNYWEEDLATGKAAGLSDTVTTTITARPDMSARMEMDLDYHPAQGETVLTEKRVIEVSAPDEAGLYHIDWQGTFTAGEKDVLLEGGTAGGGYAGMSVRISQSSGDWKLVDSEGREDVPTDHLPRNAMGIAENTHGKRAKWMDFSMVDAASQRTLGIAILDHPRNLRHPSEWHNVMVGSIPFGFFSPAVLWSKPYLLPAGERFTLRYRILVHPGRADAKMIEDDWVTFGAQGR
jgi:hypothetical protein